MRRIHWMGALVAALGTLGCGPTVGDPCTTAADCGAGLCITGEDFAPGGYCSKRCRLADEDTCPGGTVCVGDVLEKSAPACLRQCDRGGECRDGYACLPVGASKVCLGRTGL